jgi:protein O-mannosyl-transferase
MRSNASAGTKSRDPVMTARIISVVLCLITWLLFAPACHNDFVNYDDNDYVTANPEVKAGLSWTGVKWALKATAASNWHPLTWCSHMLDVSLFGLDPHGHHATSVFLQGLSAALAFIALRRLTGALWTSAFCAALFAWHPLRVESVAWVAERKDVLSGFFWFAALWAYARYVEQRRVHRVALGSYGLALAMFALGLMAKPMVITLPCVLLLLDYWPLRRWQNAAGGSRETLVCLWDKIPFFALSAGSAVVTFIVQKESGAVSMTLGVGDRLGNALVALARYLGKFFWPDHLAVLYPHPGHWPGKAVVLAAGLALVISGFACAQWRRRPWIIVGWLWFVGTLVPVIGLVQVGVQSMADRYTYLPIVGLQLALLWTAEPWLRTQVVRRAAGTVAIAILLACSVLTWRQFAVWRDSLTLFDRAIAVTSKNYMAYNNRGHFRMEHGDVTGAIADYRHALAINPAAPEANNNLGHALAETGHSAEAIPFYRKALQVRPDQLDFHTNLGNALSDIGQLDEAMEHYDFVLQRAPGHLNALNGAAVTLAMKGRLPEAVARFETILRLDPKNATAEGNLGNVEDLLGRIDAALAHYERALALKPADARTFYNLGNVLSKLGRYAEAARNYEQAVQFAPINPDAHASLGLTWARLGRREDAIRELQIALQQQPNHPQARAWLDQVLAAAPRGTESQK